MSKLDDKQNWNLFYLVNFLRIYDSCNTFTSPINYEQIMNLYGKVINKINNCNYKNEVGNISIISFPDCLEKIPKHLQMIDNFNNLRNYQQKNIINLAWFILYCHNHNLDSPEKDIWTDYSNLIKQIKSLPINEQS